MPSSLELSKNMMKGLTNSDADSLYEAIRDVKKNPYVAAKVKELGLTDEDILHYLPIIMTYGEEMVAKETCPGVDHCSLPSPHVISDLVPENGILTRQINWCPCYQKLFNVQNAYIYHDFDEAYLRLEGPSKKGLANEKAIQIALLQARKDPEKHWVFFTDLDHITTKYLVGYTNKVGLKGAKIAYINLPKRVEELKQLSRLKTGEFDEMLDKLKIADLLVLDDFGSEYKSDYTRDAILMPVLRERSRKNLQTVFVSTFERKDILPLYSGSTSSSKTAAKELALILENNLFKSIRIEAGIEEKF